MTHAAAIAAHYRTLFRLRGIAATIARGEETCDVDKVLLARADAVAMTNRESRSEADSQELIVRVSDYKPVDGIMSAPQVGDRILVTVGGYHLTLEVRPLSESEQAARHTDETRLHWRISTKVTKREVAT